MANKSIWEVGKLLSDKFHSCELLSDSQSHALLNFPWFSPDLATGFYKKHQKGRGNLYCWKLKSIEGNPKNPAQNLLKLYLQITSISNSSRTILYLCSGEQKITDNHFHPEIFLFFQAAITTVGIAVRPPVPQVGLENKFFIWLKKYIKLVLYAFKNISAKSTSRFQKPYFSSCNKLFHAINYQRKRSVKFVKIFHKIFMEFI